MSQNSVAGTPAARETRRRIPAPPRGPGAVLVLYRFAPPNSDISERAADVRSAPSASPCRITGRPTHSAPLPVLAALQNSNCAPGGRRCRDATVKVKFPRGGPRGPDSLVNINGSFVGGLKILVFYVQGTSTADTASLEWASM